MRTSSLAVSVAALVAGVAVSGFAAANCGRNHKAYPQGGILCQGGFEFVCQERGAWRKTLARCDVKPDATAPTAPPPSDPRKDPPNTTPTSTTPPAM